MIQNESSAPDYGAERQTTEPGLSKLSINYNGHLASSVTWDVSRLLNMLEDLDVRSNVRVVDKNSARPEAVDNSYSNNPSFVYMTQERLLAEVVVNPELFATDLSTITHEEFIEQLNTEVVNRIIELAAKENVFRGSVSAGMLARAAALTIVGGTSVLAGAGLYILSDKTLPVIKNLLEDTNYEIDDRSMVYLIALVSLVVITATVSTYLIKQILEFKKNYTELNSYKGLINPSDLYDLGHGLVVGMNILTAKLSQHTHIVALKED